LIHCSCPSPLPKDTTRSIEPLVSSREESYRSPLLPAKPKNPIAANIHSLKLSGSEGVEGFSEAHRHEKSRGCCALALVISGTLLEYSARGYEPSLTSVISSAMSP
jgi:hypothetical protein